MLPLSKNDINTQLWVINLGNFELCSFPWEKDFDVMKFAITDCMAWFVPNFEVWQELKTQIKSPSGDNDSIGNVEIDEDISPIKRLSLPENSHGVFNVLENFNITCLIKKFNGWVPPKGRSKIELGMETKELQVNLSPKMYNHLVNIHRIFKVNTVEEDIEANLDQKERHISESTMIC